MTTDAPNRIDLRHAAADYAAGDLTPDEAAEFERLLAGDGVLAAEVAAWRSFAAKLAPGPTDSAHAPGRGFTRSLWQRLEWERAAGRTPRPVTIPMPRWLGAAAAACLGLTIGWWGSKPGEAPPPTVIAHANEAAAPVAYQDDGGSVVMPIAQRNRWAHYMPLTAVTEVETTRAKSAPQSGDADTMKPWLGVWTKPIGLETHGTKGGRGHLVLRVACGSPAYAAGIRPGDVILSIDHCPVLTPHCVADHLVNAKPGDELLVEFWAWENASVSEVKVTLGSLCE